MNTTNHTDSSATSGDLTAAHAKIYRDAIALVCEGWYLPNDARKVLETALWAQPEAAPAPQAATPLPGGQDERAEEKSLSDYQPGQWWLDELENLWGHHGEVSADTHRAAKVACDFAKLVFAQQAAPAVPIPMILHCPSCGVQHVDAPDERTEGWINPPHRSHLCHGCGHIWRPADVPTEGVRSIQTRGKNDSPVAAPEAPTAATAPQAASPAAPIYQASMRGGWEDIERWQFDLYNDKGDGSIKTRIVYAAPPAAITASASGELGPSVPDHIITAIRTYGDFRADDDPSASAQLGEVIYALRRHYRAPAPSREAAPMPKQWHERTETMDDRSCMLAMKAEIADLRAALARKGAQPDGDLPQTLVYDPKA